MRKSRMKKIKRRMKVRRGSKKTRKPEKEKPLQAKLPRTPHIPPKRTCYHMDTATKFQPAPPATSMAPQDLARNQKTSRASAPPAKFRITSLSSCCGWQHFDTAQPVTRATFWQTACIAQKTKGSKVPRNNSQTPLFLPAAPRPNPDFIAAAPHAQVKHQKHKQETIVGSEGQRVMYARRPCTPQCAWAVPRESRHVQAHRKR